MQGCISRSFLNRRELLPEVTEDLLDVFIENKLFLPERERFHEVDMETHRLRVA